MSDTQPLNLILASASPRRSELLRAAGFSNFEVIPSRAEEDDSPIDNALRKAADVANSHPEAIVIGADTVIRMDGEVIGKPKDLDDARKILKKLSGRTHDVVTGVCVRRVKSDILVRFEEITHVVFRPLSDADIERYLSEVNVLDKAGAYAIQEHGGEIIEKIEGSRDNVIGLPTERLTETLSALAKLS